RYDLSGIRTLVLGDAAAIQSRQLLTQFRAWGMVYQLASSLAEALQKLTLAQTLEYDWHLDLVLIDGNARQVNLRETIRALRRHPQLTDTAFMVIEAAPDDREFLQNQRVEVLVPFDLKRLERRLKRLFTVAQARQQNLAAQVTADTLPIDIPESWQDPEFQSPGDSGPKGAAAKSTGQSIPLLGKVLVVEDNPVNQAVVKKMLEKSGLTPASAVDGTEALACLERENFDMVLMDCQMPRMDGYEATRKLRQREAEKGLMRIPVIAMTANAMPGDRERCLDAGMDDYLAKPIKPSVLDNKLRQWLPMQEELKREPETTPEDHQQPDATLETHRVEADDNLDYAVLLTLYETMDDDFVTILHSYLEHTPQLLKEIEQAVLEKRPESLVRPTHSLKSSSANVGAMQLSELARELELKARQGDDIANLIRLYQSLSECYRLSSEALRKIAEQGSPP
ncbi:MAG: response regulator, partial [Chromatiales bacterium]